jgi:thiaminase/transcriptional activator TenA
MRLFALALAVSAHLFGAEARFSGELWAEIAPVYTKTLQHPFLTGLADGTLPHDRFEFYLQQDMLFLTAYGQALKILAPKAPREEWRAILLKHATESIDSERQLHTSILKGKSTTEMAPSNYAYTNHLLATVATRPFSEGLAALLPCYWIYWEVGQELKNRGSRNADYQRWIDQYSDPSYRQSVDQVLRMMDAEGQRMDPAARRRAKELFMRSARYEYMFWDMAWRKERWPPP